MEKKPVQIEGYPVIENVMSVIDVHRTNVDRAVIMFLENCDRRTYRDNQTSLREHLYSITFDDYELEDALPHVRNEIKRLIKLAELNDAAYVRFID